MTFVVIPEYVARSWWERLLLQPVGEPVAVRRCSAVRTPSS